MKTSKFLINPETKKGDCCPECNANWDGGDIYDSFLSHYKDKSPSEIKEMVSHHGWTEDNPKRFGLLVGMELGYDDPNYYDGVSYWMCPKCNVAWNRFTGERTERFIKKVIPTPVNSEYRQLVYNAIKTPDGTILVSYHRHDYQTYTDKNGETYMVDGGVEYLRRNITKVPAEELSVYADEPFEKVRTVFHRGGRGKDGLQPLTYIPLCEINDNWLVAVIEYNEDRGLDKHWSTALYKTEIEYRSTNNIRIPENEYRKSISK